MKDYIIQEIDILNKVAHVSIDDYLVGSYPYKENHPYWAVFDQINNGSTPFHIKEYDKIPSIGMIYENNTFIDGEGGETFVDINDGVPNGALIEGSNEAIITLSPLNKVDGCLIVFMKYKNWVNESYAALFAALMSNPTILIEDNINNEFDYLNNLELIGTTKKIPEFSDFENFYSQGEH
jgi:hypothetical protein